MKTKYFANVVAVTKCVGPDGEGLSINHRNIFIYDDIPVEEIRRVMGERAREEFPLAIVIDVAIDSFQEGERLLAVARKADIERRKNEV